MRLIHLTHRKNVSSIKQRGLLAEMSKGKRKAVWVASPSREKWAISHLLDKFGGDLSDIVRIDLNVPTRMLTGYARGVYYVWEDIPASFFTQIRRYRVSMEVM
jgi:hypothetical protein